MNWHLVLTIVEWTLVWAWVVAHQIAIYFVFSVLVEQLPPPDQTSGKFYRYFYSVIQIFAANIRRTKDALKG